MTGRSENLLRASVVTFAGIAIGAVATLLLAQVIGHRLGAAGTGLFFQAIALFAIVSNALQLGADTALVRTLSRKVALGQRSDLVPVVRGAVGPVVAVALVVSVVVFVAAAPLAAVVTPNDPAYGASVLRIMAPFLAPGALLAVLLGGTRGIGSTLPYTALQNLALPVSRLLLVGLGMTVGLGVEWVAGAWAAPLVVVAAIAAVLLAQQLRRAGDPFGAPSPASTREFWRFAIPRGASTVLERALDWAGVLIVLAVAGPVLGGIYAVVNRCVNAGTMIDQAARIVTGPRISRALAVGDRDQASALFLHVTRGIVAVAWPFYLTLAVFAPAVLSLFGPEFVAGALPLALVSIAMMLSTTAGMVQSILLMGGRSSWQLGNRIAQLVTLVVVTVVLVPPLGLLGAALGWTAAILVDTTLATVQVAVKLGIHSSPRLVVLPAGLALAIFGGGGALCAAVLGQTVPALLTSGAVLALAYVAACILLRRQLGFDALIPRRMTTRVIGLPAAPLPDLTRIER
ncbi:MAG TPA: oligosaccharide flippase family protein [Amnibacterium sp.]|jgi:O-antigen/teichoic acid export membrane protein